MKIHCETVVESWFWGFSLATIFHICIIYRGSRFRAGDRFQVLKVSKRTCTKNFVGGGGPHPGPQGARRDMYGNAYVPEEESAIDSPESKTIADSPQGDFL